MAYWCNGLKAICERDRRCVGCKAANGKGGKYITTNAERIRAMSYEELADIIANGVGCVLKAPHCMDDDCTPCILRWLKQPVEEE